MNKMFFSLLIASMFLGFSISNALAQGSPTSQPVNNTVEQVDIENSQISWKAYKVSGEHSGILKVKSGKLEFTDNQLRGGKFVIDMTSIACTDLEGEYADKLDGHLKSPDFFSVEEFPEATFKINKVYNRGMEGDYKILGDLTIKGITKEIKFNTKISNGSALASTTLDRTDFNVKYGSGTFFGNLGDKTIYDEFDLEIKLARK